MLRWDDIAVTLKQNFLLCRRWLCSGEEEGKGVYLLAAIPFASQPAASNYFAEICRDRANGYMLAAGGSARDSGSRRVFAGSWANPTFAMPFSPQFPARVSHTPLPYPSW